MSDLTGELNLSLAVDDDDTADYLTQALRDSLNTLDGVFNSATGHSHNGAHQGGSLLIDTASIADGAVTTPKIADGAVTAPKLAAGVLQPEPLFAGSWTHQTANYTVPQTSPIMWVFCDAAIQVTLTANTNRPINVVAVTGQSTVVSTSGSVIGGSLNTSTGAVQNGVVAQGDSMTYKWDGTNWRVS